MPSSLQADDIYADSIPMKYVGKDVVIEAFKQNSGLYIQPLSASLLSAQEIQKQNIMSMKEFSVFIPNLFMPDYGSKMTSPVYIRGIGSRINSPSVALYVDGVPYFDRSTFDININDIDKIEVLRGPQGTIYGRNTMGGVINVFTKSPFKVQETTIGLNAGSHNKYETAISHYGKANDKVAYSISGNYSYAGGYFENVTRNTKADPIDAVSTRARISWRMRPRLTMHLTFAYEYSDQDGYPYRVYDKQAKKMEPINYNAPSYYRRNMSTNGLHLSYVTNQFKLDSQSSFQFFDGKQGIDQDFSPKDLYYVDFYQRQQMYSQELNIKSLSEDSKYKWQFGAFGFYQNYFQTNDTDYRSLDKHAIQSAKNPTHGFAVYHQSTLDNLFIKNLSVNLGIRYDWENTKSTLAKSSKLGTQAPIVTDPTKNQTSFSQVTPKASIQYTFNQNGIVYFSVSRGYKTGGFNNTAEDEKDRSFSPEYSWSYEIGTKSSLFNNRLHYDLSLFYIDWKDQQISQSKPSGQGFILRNAGKTVSKGVELSLQATLTKYLDMQMAYGYTHAKYKTYRENATTNYSGNYLPMVPQHTLSLGANYTISTHHKYLDKIVLNAQFQGLGKIYWNDANDIHQSFYNQLNTQISFIRKNVSANLWAKNITGQEYISYHFAALGNDFVQKGKPLTWGIKLNYKF